MILDDVIKLYQENNSTDKKVNNFLVLLKSEDLSSSCKLHGLLVTAEADCKDSSLLASDGIHSP